MGQPRKKFKARRQQPNHQSVAGAVDTTAEPMVVVRNDSKPTPAVNPQLAAVDYGPMARDLRKVFVVVVLVLAVLAGLIITNRSTGWLNRQADHLSHWLQLS